MPEAHAPLHTLFGATPSAPELHFWLRGGLDPDGQHGDAPAQVALHAARPGDPPDAAHHARLSVPDFAALVRELERSGAARPTLVFGPGGVRLHLTARSRRPGRLSVRTEGRPDVLNFSPLAPVAEEFARALSAIEQAQARIAAPHAP